MQKSNLCYNIQTNVGVKKTDESYGNSDLFLSGLSFQ